MKLLLSITLGLIIGYSAFAQEIVETRLDLGTQSSDIQRVDNKVIVKLRMRPRIISSNGVIGSAKAFRLLTTIGVWGELTSAQQQFHRKESAQPKISDLIADDKIVEQTFVFSEEDLFFEGARICVQLIGKSVDMQTIAFVCQN